MKSAPPYSVVISSCDGYADLWPYFFHFLFAYWPEAPQPVYLVTSRKHFADPRVETVALGHDRHWASNTLEAFARIPAETLLYLQEDYFLNAPARPAEIDRALAFHHRAGAHATSLFPRPDLVDPVPDAYGMAPCTAQNQWAFLFQAAFWDKARMSALIEPGWTPWHAEGEMNRKAKELGTGFYALTGAAVPALSYLQVIRGGLWLPEGRQLCLDHGFHPDFLRRPWARFQAGFLNRFHRSFLKRRSRLYRSLFGKGETARVEPLPAAAIR